MGSVEDLLEKYADWNSAADIERDLRAAYARGRADALEQAAEAVYLNVDCQGDWDEGACEEAGVEDSDACAVCTAERLIRALGTATGEGERP